MEDRWEEKYRLHGDHHPLQQIHDTADKFRKKGKLPHVGLIHCRPNLAKHVRVLCISSDHSSKEEDMVCLRP